MNKETLLEELKFCLNLWEEKGSCNFGGSTRCEQCGAPYLLLKLISGELLHDKDMRRLTLKDWKDKIIQHENKNIFSRR
ncbi:hypothetical protein KAI32_00990 [Candidatus Pacearchaeota archaeon]|nr:hypothetical protein [Candidatus Pacearchaeota archaeon]